MKNGPPYLLGIDIGTQSLRSGIFDLRGNAVAYSIKGYPVYYPQVGWAEQEPEDWWQAAKITVNECLRKAKVNPKDVVGISIDNASCTVLPAGKKGEPLRRALLWMDIRAHREVETINSTKHRILKYAGGKDSPEWMLPKALWLKKNQREIYKNAYRIVESIDWLIHKLTGRWTASKCNVTCKWNYASPEGGWSEDFLREVGLEDIVDKWPKNVLNMGEYVGELLPKPANELGLPKGIVVAQGGIDAYAGMLGLGVIKPGKLALIIGSSTCHMAFSDKAIFGSGVWGPYPDALMPGSWILEGGQTATGAIVKWFIDNFASREEVEAKEKGINIYQVLDEKAAQVKPGCEGLVLLDYWQGNRTPFRDPLARGAIWGLSLKHSKEHFFRSIYEGTAYGTRHILDDLSKHGFQTREIYACGGGTKSSLWLKIHADVCGVPIFLPRGGDAITLGAAICAGVGAEKFTSLSQACREMVHISRKIEPDLTDEKIYDFYFQKYLDTYPRLKDLMHSVANNIGRSMM